MWPDWLSNPGPLTYEPGALPAALRGPAPLRVNTPLRREAKKNKRAMMTLGRSPEYHWSQIISKSGPPV